MVLSFQVQYCLKQAAVSFQYIGGGYKMYSLAFYFTLQIHPSGEVLYHQATIEHSVAYAGEYFLTCHVSVLEVWADMLYTSVVSLEN